MKKSLLDTLFPQHLFWKLLKVIPHTGQTKALGVEQTAVLSGKTNSINIYHDSDALFFTTYKHNNIVTSLAFSTMEDNFSTLFPSLNQEGHGLLIMYKYLKYLK